MTDKNSINQNLKKRINQQLDKEVDKAEIELAEQFSAARQRALNSAHERRSRPLWPAPAWLTGAVATLLILATAVLLIPSRQMNSEHFDSLVVFIENDDIEMLENELEFYIWLETEELSEKS